MKLPKRWRMPLLFAMVGLVVLGGLAGLYIYRNYFRPIGRWAYFAEIHTNPQTFAVYALQPGQRCGDAPFAFPTRGVILGLWDESYRIGHRHSGVDIFSGTQPGVTPIYAAYPGYLSRQTDWKSTVIIRIPSDPLEPGRQIWTYYTHLASQQGESYIAAAFPPGTQEVYVEAGTFLGYMGNYSGDPAAPTGLHLHVSIVKDGDGRFLNELDIRNTYDPSPYFGLDLNHRHNRQDIPICTNAITFEPWELHHDGP